MDFLNASIALQRMETLVEDAEAIKEMVDVTIPEERRWYPFYGAELVSYYAVGFVTCLEWHARSRVADLFTYAPAEVRSEDLRGQVSDKVMVQLLAQGASVARMLAAATAVTSLSKYIAIFDRVFTTAKTPIRSREWLTSNNDDEGLSEADLAELDHLFKFRHILVHEVGVEVMGHPNIREGWSPDEALRVGRLVLRTMKRVEAGLTQYAPRDFPNLLDETGWLKSPVERLLVDIKEMEERVGHVLLGREDRPARADIDQWIQVSTATAASLEGEIDFIDRAYSLHFRYSDMRSPLKLELASARYRYLRRLLEHLDIVPG